MKKKPVKSELPPYLNHELAFEARVEDLLGRMTPEEKISQLTHTAAGIERLAIPAYDWWNEALHGVARAGIATVFPQAIGLAAMFDEYLMLITAIAISDEARAKYHSAVRTGKRERFYGLTMWSPNINIFRDPRWGRGQETYGEDPYLTSRLAVAFIRGLQSNDKKYLKTAACAKHFAAHSGPDPERLSFDAKVSKKDLYETYLPAFEAAVKEAKVEAVMGAYNRVNGEPACASEQLIAGILRAEWGFKGHVVSDCSAIENIHSSHKSAETPEAAAAMALKAGCDLNCCLEKCGDSRITLKKALASGLISVENMDKSLKRLFMTRMKLGMFDPDEIVDYSHIPADVVDCEMHQRFALGISRASMTLLKNNGILPLSKKDINSIAVTGPNADNIAALLGNYNGTPSSPVTPLKGLMKSGIEVNYSRGCGLTDKSRQGFAAAIADANSSDVIVFCAGLSPEIEGEECDTGGFERSELGLPGVQEELLDELKKTGKRIILVLLSGSALSVDPTKADAIIQAWYPGQSGGEAVADVIFGKYNPAGRLPVTVYKSAKDLPDFRDYSMENRTYRYFKGDVLYPFGYGLSYSRFEYKNLKIGPAQKGRPVKIRVEVENTGKCAGDEVVQLYIKDIEATCRVPQLSLAGFKRITLKTWQKETVEFTVSPEQLSVVNEDGKKMLEPGEFEVYAGGVQPGFKCESTMVVSGRFRLE